MVAPQGAPEGRERTASRDNAGEMPTNFAAAAIAAIAVAIPDRKEDRNSKVSLTNPKASPFFSPDVSLEISNAWELGGKILVS